MKQSVTVGAQFLWGGRYGCNNGHYGCTIVMSYIEINKAVSQWLLTFNLCVSVTWPLTCAFHIPCTHTPEIIDMHRGVCDNAFITHANLKCKKCINLCDEICVWFYLKVGNKFCSLYLVDWRNLMKQSVTVGAQLLWGGRNGCNNGRHGCTIVMSYIEINKAVSQCLLTFNLCVSVTWPLTCAFHIPCTHTPEITDMHRGVCDNTVGLKYLLIRTSYVIIKTSYLLNQDLISPK